MNVRCDSLWMKYSYSFRRAERSSVILISHLGVVALTHLPARGFTCGGDFGHAMTEEETEQTVVFTHHHKQCIHLLQLNNRMKSGLANCPYSLVVQHTLADALCSIMLSGEIWLTVLTPDTITLLDSPDDVGGQDKGQRKGGEFAVFAGDEWCNSLAHHDSRTLQWGHWAVSMRPFYLPKELS